MKTLKDLIDVNIEEILDRPQMFGSNQETIELQILTLLNIRQGIVDLNSLINDRALLNRNYTKFIGKLLKRDDHYLFSYKFDFEKFISILKHVTKTIINKQNNLIQSSNNSEL